MRRKLKTASAAAAATTAITALAAGLTSTAEATPAPTTVPTAVRSAEAFGGHRVTLITGDRVVVGAKGQVVGMERAKGRERVPVQMRRVDGHTLVIPTDAAQMIASGRLDQRLFDITELNKAAIRRNQGDGLKVIVGYNGTVGMVKAARADVRDTSVLRRTFRNLNMDSVRTPSADVPRLWDAVTHGDGMASGVSHVWLDGIRKASLDKSVPQIGAPAAWAKGYDGKGVKVAVLDTGVDANHPDLKGQVIAAKNFTSSPDTDDHFGHGTHVASIVAGTGAKSGGKYRGVAPGARILNGKVLNDKGDGDDSAIIAGIDWAAEQGADIVNLSLGIADTPGVDPMEAEVNRLSEEKGILFAIAAGNEGEAGPYSVDSPGSAADALTVGAVNGKDEVAEFSSLGPTADSALKPDVTAPGVDITAALAPGSVVSREYQEKPPGYVTLSGTSMATPHVAGAAALLKQQHPHWTFRELKGALVASAKGGAYQGIAEGSGRIRVDKALPQSVVADPSSVSFPLQRYPHNDDTPATKKLTYRNLGKKAITLALSAKALGPNGKAAPTGFFALGADKVTVPAGGTASVDVTVNTRPGGKLDGAYSAAVTATGGGQTVRSMVGVERETEAYDVTVKFVNRPGRTPVHFTTLTPALRGAGGYTNVSGDNAVTFRVPKGSYMLDSFSQKAVDSAEGGADWLAQPVLKVDKDTMVTFDLNKTRAADITVPDAGAKPLQALVSYEYQPADIWNSLTLPSFSDIRIAHVGPAQPSGLVQTWSGQWTKGNGTEYDIVGGGEVKKVVGDRVHHYKASELATVKAGLGASSPGKTGAIALTAAIPSGYGLHTPVEQKLPATRTLHLSTGEGAEWYFDFRQYSGKKDEDDPISDASANTGSYEELKGGRTYRKTFNTAVFAPRVIPGEYGVFHSTDGISGNIPLFADSAGHETYTDIISARTTLYRNGRKVGSNADPLTGNEVFKVPAGDAEYTLTTTVKRSAKVQAATTRIDASWTFHSKRPSSGLPTELPVSTVRFEAKTGLDSMVEAGRTVTFPVTVEGAAKGLGLKSLSVYVSYDDGRTWKKADVRNGKVTIKNPAKEKSISLHAKITDKKGNTSVITIHNAYYGK
ncbi:S8 family peptidase [Streptomyces guryensis]|uniref:S8 family serine peptidase n=1 Tax=Streptomyces guryensis TaxID=2886947 RepID=A0A9Q3VYA1_9ACTN|nr:S8 family peptidase [Streptomyces guryensis]MCD9879743.1 S8 family serine peptidase [Streptomyces guryensis]